MTPVAGDLGLRIHMAVFISSTSWCLLIAFLLVFLTYFTHHSAVSIADFEKVNAGWAEL